MEDLIENDATFELYHNSEGEQLLNNRVLLSYPSEKSSFDVFLGADGDDMFDYSYFESTIPQPTLPSVLSAPVPTGTNDKPKFDPDKLTETITQTAGAISAVGSTVKAFQGDGTRTPSRRKQLKEACGRKPLLRKNRGEYDKCVAKFNEGNNQTRTSQDVPPPPPPPPTEPPNNRTRNIIIGVVVVGVLATAFIGYKKGWFGKKAG